MKHRIIIFLLPLLFLAGCSKDSSTSDPTLANSVFKGITQTKDDPTPIGWIDPDDWKSDGYWNFLYPISHCDVIAPSLNKIGLMSPDTVFDDFPLPTSVKLYPAYPNPGGPNVRIEFSLPKQNLVYCAIIGHDYKIQRILICNSLLPAGLFSVVWDGKNQLGEQVTVDVYRCIFLVTTSDGGFVFSSHGDIWIKY